MPNSAALTALGQSVIHPVWVAFLDITGDPVRVTTAPYAKTFSSTGDSDLDGFTFDALSHELVAVSPVQHKDTGSETVTATLSGLIGVDTALMNAIGDKSKWQGRVARLWMGLLDTNLSWIDVWPYYTGYMAVPKISGSVESQVITLEIESYLASLSEASNRTYLDQKEFDSGDLSAEAAIAIANGTSGSGLSPAVAGTTNDAGMGGFGGGARMDAGRAKHF